MGFRLLLSFSLANLFFMRVWHKLLYSKGYFSVVPIGYDIAILLACILLLTGFNFALFRVAVQARMQLVRYASRLILLANLFFPANFIRGVYGFSFSTIAQLTNIWITALVGAALLTVAGYLLVRYSDAALRVFQVILMLLFPYSLLNIAQAAIVCKGVDAPSLPSVSQPALHPSAAKKIVWLIFDETDMRLAFSERPVDLQLPNFDRFAGEALVAENAYPPAGETLRSLPALLSGRMISFAIPRSAYDLSIKFDGEKESQALSTTENVFSLAQQRGYGTGMVGFYHPYPRMIGNTLDYCSWQPYELFHSPSTGFLDTMLKHFAYALIVSEGIQLNKWGEIQHHIQLYKDVLASGSRALADDRLNLVVIHVPVPHLPAIIDRKTMRFRTQNSTKGDYFDNLALADKTLGTLRRLMEQQGIWDSTTVIISSDHWWRGSKGYDGKADHRVPFMLKLAGQHQHVAYAKQFNTVKTAPLVLDILENHILNPIDAIQWLDKNSTTGPSPYYNKL